MNRALLEVLRCPEKHDESWLVSSVSVSRGVHIVEGELECPVCGSVHHVHDGIGVFDGSSIPSSELRDGEPIDRERVISLAAQLGVIAERDPVLLHGRYSMLSLAYAGLADAQVVAIQTSSDSEVASESGFTMERQNDSAFSCPQQHDNVSLLQIGRQFPIGASTLAGAAVEPGQLHPQQMAKVIAALRQHARLVVPAGSILPSEMRSAVAEIASDASVTVYECVRSSSGLASRRQMPPAL